MTKDCFQPTSATTPALLPLARAVRRSPELHVVLLVYLQLLMDLEDRTPLRSTAELAADIGYGLTQVKYALRLLFKLGLVARGKRGQHGRELLVFQTVDAEQLRWLTALDQGIAVAQLKDVTITGSDGTEFDYSETVAGRLQIVAPATISASDSRSSDHLDVRSSLQRPSGQTLHAAESTVSVSDATTYDEGVRSQLVLDGVVPAKTHIYRGNSIEDLYSKRVEVPVTAYKKKTTKIKKLVPADPITSDPRWDDVQAVQNHANATFGVDHRLVNSSGQTIGAPKGEDRRLGRAGVIWRALVLWEYTVEQLCAALTLASKDPWWTERRINDTTKLLRKQEHIQSWLDKSDRGQGAGFDRRGLVHAKVNGDEAITSERM